MVSSKHSNDLSRTRKPLETSERRTSTNESEKKKPMAMHKGLHPRDDVAKKIRMTGTLWH